MKFISSILQRLAPSRQRSASSAARSAVPRTRAKTPLRKALPDVALVDTTGKSSISVDDGVASLDEVGAAGLPVTSISISFLE